MKDLVDGLPDTEALLYDERRRAVCLLLKKPFVSDESPDPETFVLIRQHEAELRRRFRDMLGYRLVIDHEMARLAKVRAPDARPRPILTRGKKPFDRRRYSLLCLILAVLERSEVQTILSTLAEEVKILSAASDGVAPGVEGSLADLGGRGLGFRDGRPGRRSSVA